MKAFRLIAFSALALCVACDAEYPGKDVCGDMDTDVCIAAHFACQAYEDAYLECPMRHNYEDNNESTFDHYGSCIIALAKTPAMLEWVTCWSNEMTCEDRLASSTGRRDTGVCGHVWPKEYK